MSKSQNNFWGSHIRSAVSVNSKPGKRGATALLQSWSRFPGRSLWLEAFPYYMHERVACMWPIKSARVGFLIGVSHKLCIHRAYGTGTFWSRSPQHIRKVRTAEVKGTWLTAAKQASVFSPRKAGSRSRSSQLLSVKLLFSASLVPLQPITEVAIFRYYAKSCFDVMYLLYVIKGIVPPRGHKVLHCSCPDMCGCYLKIAPEWWKACFRWQFGCFCVW